MRVVAASVLLVGATARAEPPQLQADLGLAVIGIGYERPVVAHIAVMVEAQIFGTYFLPWLDAGNDVAGFGLQARATWLASATGHGLYVAAFARGDGVRDGGSDGVAVSGGGIVGWAFAVSERVDVRLGAGAQYIWMTGGNIATSTPFPTLDLVVGYRL